MKKPIAIILSALLLFTACGGEKKGNADGKEYAAGYETARHSPKRTSLCLNGIFYNDENEDSDGYAARRLWFYDFDSMQSVILCARPNCLHKDTDTCTAFGIDCWNGYPTIINNKLYFFDEERAWGDNGEVLITTNVWKAATDGGSRVKIDTIGGMAIRDLVTKGSAVYFTAAEETYEDYTGTRTGYVKAYICSYDFEKEKFVNYGLLAEGYDTGADVFGEYNGGLYINGYYAAERGGEWIKYRLRFDLETGEITEWDMPISSLNKYGSLKPMFASGGFYGYMNGDNTVIVDCKGNEMVLEDYELTDLATTPVNGYCFNVDNGTAIDLSNGEILEINMDIMPKYGYVLCYHNGSYIISNQTEVSDFRKAPADEIFKELGQ